MEWNTIKSEEEFAHITKEGEIIIIDEKRLKENTQFNYLIQVKSFYEKKNKETEERLKEITEWLEDLIKYEDNYEVGYKYCLDKIKSKFPEFFGDKK